MGRYNIEIHGMPPEQAARLRCKFYKNFTWSNLYVTTSRDVMIDRTGKARRYLRIFSDDVPGSLRNFIESLDIDWEFVPCEFWPAIPKTTLPAEPAAARPA